VTASTPGVIVAARGDVRIRATGDLANPPGGWFEILDIAVIGLSLAAWLAWIVIQIPTYRRADGERRQQLKWLYSGATVTLVAFVFGVFVVPVTMGHAPGYPNNPVISALVVLAFEFDAVRDDLVGVVHEAFQPTQVSVWLVEARAPARGCGTCATR
jgi:hypothetical protein